MYNGMFGSPFGQNPLLMQQRMQQMQQMGPSGQAPGMAGPPPMLGGAQPAPAPQGGQGDHHSKLHDMLPYLAMGLLPMILGAGGGGSIGQIAQFASPFAFGLHKAKVF